MDISNRNNIIADTVILYIGIFLNLGVLIHLYKTWVSRNRVQFYVLTLCLADCLGLILRQCTEIGLHTTFTWNTGTTGCKIIMSMALSGTCLAHFLLVSFNVDNLVTVIFKRSPWLLRITLFIIAFLLTGLCLGAQAYFYHIEEHPIYPQLRQCTPFGSFTEKEEMTYIIVESLALFWFPESLFIILSVTIFLLIRKGYCMHQPDDEDEERDLFTMKSDIIYASVLGGCFFLCWLPYSTQQIFIATKIRLMMDKKTIRLTWNALTYLSMLNHCLNPVIYGAYCFIWKRCKSSSKV